MVPPIIWGIGFLSLIILERVMEYKSRRACALEDRLKQKWEKAREERMLWEKEHLNPTLFFYSQEYRELWRTEIEAESLFLHHAQKTYVTTSWYEYCKMKQEAGHEV